MKPRPMFHQILIYLFISMLIVSCDVKGQAGFKPTGLPLKVTIDTNGEISFEVDPEVEYPTPIGTFSAGIVIDPISYFGKQTTLTVRLNGEDHFFDLHGNDFSITFDSGYYEKIQLTKRGNDLLLELRQKALPMAVASPVNTPYIAPPVNNIQPTINAPIPLCGFISEFCTPTPNSNYPTYPVTVYSRSRCPIGDTACGCSGGLFLSVGEKVSSLGSAYIRSEPGKSSPSVGSLQQDETATVLYGPYCVNENSFSDYPWFKISTEDGKVGWVSNVPFLGVFLLLPQK